MSPGRFPRCGVLVVGGRHGVDGADRRACVAVRYHRSGGVVTIAGFTTGEDADLCRVGVLRQAG